MSGQRRNGFTLLELLVVMVIIGLLAGFVAPRYFAQVGKSQVKVTRAQIDALDKALDQFRIDVGRYPTTEEGLQVLIVAPSNEPNWGGPYLKKGVPPDPWVGLTSTRTPAVTGISTSYPTARTAGPAARAKMPTSPTGKRCATASRDSIPPAPWRRMRWMLSTRRTRAVRRTRAGSKCCRCRAGDWDSRDEASELPLVPFTNELIALLEAGLSLVEAIDGLAEKERDPAVRSILEALRARLYEGRSLSAALAASPATFPTLYVATVRASERSGAISEALQRFVTYQERIDVLKRQLINASIYPAVLLGVGSLVVVFLLAYVVPRFSGIYEEIGGELPLASRLLMQWGRLLDAHGTLVLGGALAFAAACVALALRPATRAAVGRAVAAVPAIRHQLKLYQLARLYRTCGMLLRGGLPVVTAFDMTGGLLSAATQPSLVAAAREVREGRSLTESLTHHGLTTPVGERMLRVGERSGNMGEMMERVASF